MPLHNGSDYSILRYRLGYALGRDWAGIFLFCLSFHFKLSLSLLFSLYLTLDIGINPPLPFFLFLFGALVYCLRPFCFSVVCSFYLNLSSRFCFCLPCLSFMASNSIQSETECPYCIVSFHCLLLLKTHHSCVYLSLSLSLSPLSLSLSLSLTLPLSLFVIGYLAVSLYVRVSRYLSFTASLLFCHRYLLMQQSP